MKHSLTIFCIVAFSLPSGTVLAKEKADPLKSQTVIIGDKDDWVQLKSGEVLKGELNGTVKKESNSYDQEIEFDSDDLGDQEIELEDISLLETAGFFTIRTANGDIHDGYLSIRDNQLYMTKNGLETSFPIHDVVSIYRGTEKDSDYWTTELFVGLDISKGNTEEFSLLGEIEGERNTVDSRSKLYARHEVSESNSEKTAEKTQVSGSYDIYLNNRLFFRPVNLMVLSDEFQNLDYQVNAAMQIGYFFIANADAEWDVSVGPGLQYNNYTTVEQGEETHTSSTTLALESNFEYELTKDIDFSHTYTLNWASDNAGGMRHENDLGFDIDLVTDLDLSIKAIWEHVSQTKAASNGITPEKDDYKLHFGLSYEI
ncbi:DUF481 domain-containing protein [Vibrio ostreicida]|uniref:DUF481 domain-containing protein n=1 Tax=Vibrio ostreicida TaxID=526588 RepID=A0ABT8C0M5_9VIBR|nr:DUF481 domain-containing protein [Vibrio ostreicida]MDN3611905.1 DUF481 domain-containing protein [Vibrio ostreicida]NPD08912.1 DUF481 domain-containing protein [Vibrio ostreicida]